MTPRDVTDTSKTPPEHLLADAVARGVTDAILLQESQGQREIVESDVIPTDIHCTEDDLKALGFELGQPLLNDPMFRTAKLPLGWKREGSSHAMWSYIVDEHGYRRVSIFYKAAFYDRNAHLSLSRVPETAAQAEARNKVYEELERPANPTAPTWRSGYADELLDDGNLRVVWFLDQGYRPTLRHAKRVVVFAPDGGRVSDETTTFDEPLEAAR